MSLINVKTDAEIPSEWWSVFRAARENPSPFIVHECKENDFFNFSAFLKSSYKRNCPFPTRPVVEASHANAHARAIAFFSYIWFKYNILSLYCCKLCSVVVIMLSYQPSAPRFDSWLRSEYVTQYAGTGKEIHVAIFFQLQNLALQLGLGQGCQPEGIAIT